MSGARPHSTAHAPRRVPAPVEAFSLDDLDGVIVSTYRPADGPAELARVLDPAAAIRTLHWGRHYVYAAELRTQHGPVPVVVKQFRNDGWQARWRRLRHGSAARLSWDTAMKFVAAGIGTPEPILMAESRRREGPSYLVTRFLPSAQEARYLLRALNAADPDHRPSSSAALLESVARAVRDMHDAGFWHRDVSVGNVLVQPSGGAHERPDVLFVDLNRARVRAPGLVRRSRDLCRLWIARSSDRLEFVNAYWRGDERALWLKIGVYSVIYHAFRAREAIKPPVRRAAMRWRDWIVKPRPSPHVPAAPVAASRRDKAVWDALSDQPVQKANRWEKLGVRLADAPEHARQYAAVVAALPRIVRRFQALRSSAGAAPIPMGAAGVCVSPLPGATDALLEALTALGARHVLIRLQSWSPSQESARDLAQELHARGFDLTFVIAQNRAVVKDGARWSAAVDEIAATFTAFGRHFQIGQAINRSKWGVWTLPEYWGLFAPAAAALRRARPDVELLGPSIIDFEFERLAAAVNLPHPGVHFDIVSSLLYVDRRGAPENRQLGFDTSHKAILLRAVADTARCASPRAWITETNWALWEGPYSPAGRRTSVDEATQADYLARYVIITLATGLIERVYWWQLAARGYGLMDISDPGALRRRPSFDALATFVQQLEGASSYGRLPSPPDTRVYRFRRGADDILAAWSTRGPAREITLPARVLSVVDRDGARRPIPHGRLVAVTGSPQYFIVDGL